MSIDQDCMYAQIVPSGQEGTRISTGLLQFRNNFAVQKQVCVFAFVCMFVRTCAIACAHISVYLCVCVWCVCVCVCVCQWAGYEQTRVAMCKHQDRQVLCYSRCRLHHYTKLLWREIKTKDTLEPKMGCRTS
jgi:hypothetical protein